MSEQLVIRLSSEPHQTIHWLIWADSEKKIIASGELENAEELKQLQDKALSCKVICLLPSVDVTLKSVKIKGAFTRQIQQALPYMLEDDLACDVEQLHFSVFAKETNLIEVAVCAKNKMQLWLSWLNAAEISPFKFIPEALALPVPTDQQWQALRLGKQWIIRESLNSGWSCESEMLDSMLQLRLMDNTEQVINSYSGVVSSEHGKWRAIDSASPMHLLARGCVNGHINMLNGEFKIQKESNLQIAQWKLPLIAISILFIFAFINLVVQHSMLEKQTEQVKKQVETVYKKAFPTQRALQYSRIKKKIKGLLNQASEVPEADFLIILNDLLPVFKAVPSLQISSLKFNSKKKEINLSVSTDSFQAFEQLAKQVPVQYQLEQGVLSNNKNRVSGLLTVKVK